MQRPAHSTDSRSRLADVLAIARYHIVGVAVAAELVFSRVLVGRAQPAVALVTALDWFLINLMNRITDVDEDAANGIAGTALVARHRRLFSTLATTLLLGSFAATHLVWPRLTPWRAGVQLVGLAYNYRLVPTLRRGFRRFKEIYFFKNFMSALLFVATCFAYPLVAAGGERAMGMGAVVTLALFFVPFELTYEILYDLRDLDGDRAEGIPTYPVVHGPLVARRIIDALLALSVAVLAIGFFLGAVGVREAMMVAAPLVQLVFYRRRFARGLTSRDCIVLTHLGTAQLLLFLVGNTIWLAAGLPADIFLR